MKKNSKYVIALLVITTTMISCVSKKKYEDLMHNKLALDRNVLMLKREKQNLIHEFEEAKKTFNSQLYKLTQNNAIKDKELDKINLKLNKTDKYTADLKSQLAELQDRSKLSQKSSQEQFSTLENNLKKTMQDRDNIRKEMSEIQNKLDWENRKLKDELELKENKNKTLKAEYNKLFNEISLLKKKLSKLQITKSKGDSEIKKLTNQVELLKKELFNK